MLQPQTMDLNINMLAFHTKESENIYYLSKLRNCGRCIETWWDSSPYDSTESHKRDCFERTNF